jgi:serine/threonine protein kinase
LILQPASLLFCFLLEKLLIVFFNRQLDSSQPHPQPPQPQPPPQPPPPPHTLGCRAPEHGFPGHKRPNQDIWSVGIIVAELAAGRPLYDSSVRNRDILKFYGDTNHDFHPGKLHKTMPELQGMSDAFHDFLDEVFLSSAERPFAVELLEHNIWLEGQVRRLVGVVWRVFPRLVSPVCCVVLLAQ